MSRKKSLIKYKSINRIYFMFLLFIVIYGFLIYRLVDIQITHSDLYKKCAKDQSVSSINLSSGRGTIYDRNNRKITDTKSEDVIIIQKEKMNMDDGYMKLIEEATGLDSYQIYKKIQKDPVSPIVELKLIKINNKLKTKLEKENIIIDKKIYRYSDEDILAHTIGYIDKDSKGVSGIEKSKDEILKDKNLNYVEVFKAGSSGNSGSNKKIGVLDGSLKVNQNSKDDRHLKLTIDYNIQKKLEKIVDKEKNPSAVVISDVKSGEILAMTSRPNFDRDCISKYLKMNNGELENRSIKYMYAPGSVFKIVVLYAALEQGVIDENYTYTCTGSSKLNNRVLKCNKLDGHGKLNVEQAFANSCNTAFLDIALKVGKEKIIDTAKKLHLDQEVGIDIYGEKSGNIDEDIDIVNLCIGQGKMMFTPLQVNQMTQVIANNGLYEPLKIYDSVINNKKEIIKKFRSMKKDNSDVSPYIVNKIKNMMKSVAQSGTAKELAILEKGCGVKTGTTQAAINVENADKTIGKKIITHGWVTGFYPKENPKYTITVIIEGTKDYSKSAIPLFKEICESILK